MIVLSPRASAAERWLAHLVRAAAGSIRRGDLFDDDVPFDEAAAIRLAMRHRVAPLLGAAFAEGRIADAVDPDFVRACREAYTTARRRNRTLLAVGHAVREALARSGVRAAPLGGFAALLGPDGAHSDPGLRPLGELRLLVARADWTRCVEILSALGFLPTAAPGAPAEEIRLARAAGHDAAQVCVRFALRSADASAGAAERFFREMASEDPALPGAWRASGLGNLLALAAHAADRALARWIWLLDAHRLVSRVAAEPLAVAGDGWPGLVRATRAWRLRRPMYAALAASRELLRTPVPKEVLAELAPGPVRRRLLHRTLSRTRGAPAGTGAGPFVRALLEESWWDAARAAASALPGAPTPRAPVSSSGG